MKLGLGLWSKATECRVLMKNFGALSLTWWHRGRHFLCPSTLWVRGYGRGQDLGFRVKGCGSQSGV